MARWDEREIGIEECPECGEIYKVKIIRLPLRDQNDFKCKCGYVMRTWNGTLTYHYELQLDA